jgi:signal transduction histidine kinase
MSRGQTSSIGLVDVGAAVRAVARLIEPTARTHGVRIDVAPPAIDLRVRADDAGLQHALMNLLINAVQACRTGGRVEIRVVPGDPVRIQVADDGCGIAAEDQRRIFEPFYGLRQGGTGLGLFLSLTLARQWGGDIQVASTPGAGATFSIVVPATARAAAS